MPAPPLDDAVLAETLAVYDRVGSYTGAARELGVTESTVRARVREARARGLHLSPGVRSAAERLRLAGREVRGGWLHDYDPETGRKLATLYWRAPEAEPEDLAERVAAALAAVPPCPEVDFLPWAEPRRELCVVYPLFDLHFGMRAWGQETAGPDYDTGIAARVLRDAAAALLLSTRSAYRAILLLGGDTLHADDDTAQTPRHRHVLDVDSRHDKVLRATLEALEHFVVLLARQHHEVVVKVLRGNHDESACRVLKYALHARFRDTRVQVDLGSDDFFMTNWGDNALFAYHGDRIPPQRAVFFFADVCPFWSTTKHRIIYTGHYHKLQTEDFGAAVVETVRPFAPADHWAASSGYTSRPTLRADMFHATRGRVAVHTVALDQFLRDATGA